MTNVERARRHLTSNTFCGVRAGEQEDMEHLFRRCPKAMGIWNAVLGPTARRILENLSWDEWLQANLKGDASMGLRAEWPSRFIIRLWWIWRWRNEAIFEGNDVPMERKLVWLLQKEKEVETAFAARSHSGSPSAHSAVVAVSWNPPENGWMTVNVDGSCSTARALAGCGGALRDHTGDWRGGFIHKVGTCTPEVAEAWGVLHGLQLASHLGVRKLIVESDSQRVINLLRLNTCANGNVSNII